ncbi:MAG: prepilin-type N-terminal cleavage/methylation domain-containing protein [Planctomycetes bacterium]|nr:prepilin-type N-terminal cleavage/methylation domain-containing protein [Planctomycetota bacterium]
MIRPTAGRFRPGFTILEILVVLSILALLGGLSIGAFQAARRSYLLAASAARIQGILRAARNTSIATSTPSFVVIDPAARLVKAQSYETIGEWSFEGRGAASGGLAGFSQDSAVAGSAPGRVGAGLAPGTYVDCGRSSRFDVRDGLFLEAWVRHEEAVAIPAPPDQGKARRVRLEPLREEEEKPARCIAARKGAFSFGMTPWGALEAAIGPYRARTAPGVVPPFRWVFVTVRYDGQSLAVAADGVDRELRPIARGAAPGGGDPSSKLPSEIPLTREPFTISSPESPFPGCIDEVRLRGRIEPLAYEHADFEMILGWKRTIHFDARGHLDPAHHEEGERIVLIEVPDVRSSSTTVSVVDYSVTYEEWRERFLKKDDPGDPLLSSRSPVIEPRRVLERRIEESYALARKVVIEVDRLGVIR